MEKVTLRVGCFGIYAESENGRLDVCEQNVCEGEDNQSVDDGR